MTTLEPATNNAAQRIHTLDELIKDVTSDTNNHTEEYLDAIPVHPDADTHRALKRHFTDIAAQRDSLTALLQLARQYADTIHTATRAAQRLIADNRNT